MGAKDIAGDQSQFAVRSVADSVSMFIVCVVWTDTRHFVSKLCLLKVMQDNISNYNHLHN